MQNILTDGITHAASQLTLSYRIFSGSQKPVMCNKDFKRNKLTQ